MRRETHYCLTVLEEKKERIRGHHSFRIEWWPLIFDFALDKACNYVNGSDDIAGSIRHGIHFDFTYDPANSTIDSNPLTMYDVALGDKVCADYANLLRKDKGPPLIVSHR